MGSNTILNTLSYQKLPKLRLATLYLAGRSLRSLAEEYGVGDTKTLKKYLEPYVYALTGEDMRTHAQSQGVRRRNEAQQGIKQKPRTPANGRLTKREVRSWDDPFIRRPR